MVQIATAFVATTLLFGTALASTPDYYRRESYSDDILERDVDFTKREDLEQVFQRALDMADTLEEREPFIGAIIGAIAGAVKRAKAKRAAKKAAAAAAHHRRELEDELEEREINDEVYDELD